MHSIQLHLPHTTYLLYALAGSINLSTKLCTPQMIEGSSQLNRGFFCHPISREVRSILKSQIPCLSCTPYAHWHTHTHTHMHTRTPVLSCCETAIKWSRFTNSVRTHTHTHTHTHTYTHTHVGLSWKPWRGWTQTGSVFAWLEVCWWREQWRKSSQLWSITLNKYVSHLHFIDKIWIEYIM